MEGVTEFLGIDALSAVVENVRPYLQGPVAMYAGWTTLHYMTAHAYSNYCVNWSMSGFLMSPFTVTTPMCRGMSWVIYEGSNAITYFWVVMGTTASVYMTKRNVV